MTSGTSTAVEEHIVVAAPAAEVFAAVADVRRMARWSPECFAVWIWRRQNGRPARFVGWNRSGPFVWFSTCRVRVADPGVEFAFDVTRSDCLWLVGGTDSRRSRVGPRSPNTG